MGYMENHAVKGKNKHKSYISEETIYSTQLYKDNSMAKVWSTYIIRGFLYSEITKTGAYHA